MELFLSALKYVRSSIWKDDHDEGFVFSAAKKYFDEAKVNCTFGKRFFRLTGQSGSGKTSQLFASTLEFCKQKNIRPLHIAVRNYCHLYPNFSSISKNEMREKTNGFSLKVLLFVLKLALESGVDIILELALLGKNFEKYIIFMLKKQNYRSIFQIMSVNKLISDIFILKRKLKSGRQTLPSSADYFYSAARKSLKFISKNFDCPAIIWTVYDLSPAYFGSLKNCLNPFTKNQKRIEKIIIGEEELKNAKLNFLLTQFPDGNF